ncbi:MAG: type II secretion system protein N [Pseudomonadota bacterium]
MDFQPRALAPLAVRWSRPLAMTAAVGWLTWTLAQWTWQMLPAPPSPASPSPSPRSEPAPSVAQPPRLAETINAAAPWGRPQVIDGGSAQDTRLPLALRGVLAGQGLALIAASGQPERVYRAGDRLPGGVILRSVLADHVLLERAGTLERLALPKETLPSGSAPASPPKAAATGSLRALLQSSPAELAKHFRLEPVVEAGQIRGYRIRALRDPALLQRAGLEPEDILLSVNGRSLLEAPDIAGLMNNLRDAAALDAVVLRHGIETPLRIDLNG